LFSLLGILAIAIIIWFAGPLIGIAGHLPMQAPTTRLMIILGIILFWGLNNLRLNRQAIQANDRLIDGLLQSTPTDRTGRQQQEELALVRGRFEKAMEILKQSRPKQGPRNLYNQPWYIIIGPPGSGKTTALAHSGLHFPLAKQFGTHDLKFKGIGGTRHCDWWFTEEAVLLDTAGRYVTQDSQAEVDSAMWIGFLELLKHYRRRRPINGVLVAISLVDLMQQDEYERGQHVTSIRQRIKELHQHFGIRFPIYVVLTKCDLVAGFSEYFDDLDIEGRSQVWGFTFDLDEKLTEEILFARTGEEFSQLIRRLSARLIRRLNQERDLRQRNLIYTYPQQMAAIKSNLQRFISETFQSPNAAEPLLLRGVYFTSGTQEGTPIDRLMGSLTRTLGLGQNSVSGYTGHGRSHFIRGLLTNVIFPEAELASVNRRLEARRAWLKRVVSTSAIGLTAMVLLIEFTQFTANQFYINRVAAKLPENTSQFAESRNSQLNILDVLPQLDALRAAKLETRKHSENMLLHIKDLVYQDESLGDAVSGAYKRVLNNEFFPRLVAQMEQQLRQGKANRLWLYEALKTYLMLGNPTNLDADFIGLWMKFHWQQMFPNQTDEQYRLYTHLIALLHTSRHRADLDDQLVASARRSLHQVPLAEFVYSRLKLEFGQRRTLAFHLIDAIGEPGESVFEYSGGPISSVVIAALYTYRGYHEIYKKYSPQFIDEIHRDRWVLGKEADEHNDGAQDRLQEQLDGLYLEDYIRSWKNLLDHLEVRHFDTLEQALEIVSVLAGSANPLAGLVRALEQNTLLARSPANTSQVAQSAFTNPENMRMQNRLTRLMGSATTPPSSGTQELSEQIEKQFKPLTWLVHDEGGGRLPIDRTTQIIADLYQQLIAVDSDVAAEHSMRSLIDGGGNDAIHRLSIESSRQPEPLQRWFVQLADDSQRVASSRAHARLNALWQTEVVPQCRRLLAKRYPLDKNSSREVTLGDFGRFFGPDGSVDRFFNKYLIFMVDRSTQPWKWRTKVKQMIGLSDNLLTEFERARRIRDAFFLQGGQDPRIVFQLKPVYLDKRVSRFLLEVDGQQFTYRFGPTFFSKAQWPGPTGARKAQIVFNDRNGKIHLLSKEGQWAWFRLLDSAQLKNQASNRLELTFNADGFIAIYEIQVDSAANPFLMKEVQEFRCPAKL
jgi:type VI secretion system protein ImpL